MKRLTAISIRTRLLVAYIGIIVIGFSGITAIAGGQITSSARADYEQRLQDQIKLIAQSLTSSTTLFTNNQIDQTQADAVLKTFEPQVGATLKLVVAPQPHKGNDYNAGDGPPPARPFMNMPELETAMGGQTVVVERKDDTGQETLYTASPVICNQQISALVQLAVPIQNLQGIVNERWAVIALGFVLLTSLAILAALALSRSIIQPLYKLRESALRLSRGDFSHRVAFTWKDEIGEVAVAFNEMAAQVQSMLEEQRAFASNTSHELRTPLTALRLRTEALLYDTTLDKETSRQYVEELDQEITKLGNLVDDLTLLSRFDAGRAELGRDQIDCNRLAANLCQEASEQAEEKHIHLTCSPSPEPALVNASLSHLTVVFRNLLDNALKYTPEGGTITWSIAVAQNSIDHVIQDTGQGIPAQDLPHIYERFYRADKAHSRDIPGTGLGLALVKSIIEAYGGYIHITSEGPGRGTLVKVRWPVTPVTA